MMFFLRCFLKTTPPKTNMSPKKNYFNRKYIFQPVIFRGHVSFPGGNMDTKNGNI